MRNFSPILALFFLFGCEQGKQYSTEKYPIGNAEEWLNGDENFGKNQKQQNKKLDTAQLVYSLYSDLNNDGIIDTAEAIINNKTRVTEIRFSCFKAIRLNYLIKELVLNDAGDLNNDNKHEIVIMQQGSESCWDNLKLYSLADNWQEKYSGVTYQCTDKPTYSFSKLNSRTLQLITLGNSTDSIDASTGDTLEQILPNEQKVHLIKF